MRFYSYHYHKGCLKQEVFKPTEGTNDLFCPVFVFLPSVRSMAVKGRAVGHTSKHTLGNATVLLHTGQSQVCLSRPHGLGWPGLCGGGGVRLHCDTELPCLSQ